MTETVLALIFTGLFALHLLELGMLFRIGNSQAELKTRMDNFEHPEGYHA